MTAPTIPGGGTAANPVTEGADEGPAGRKQADHAALRRPLQGRDRADADRPVVRRHRQDRRPGASTPCATGEVNIMPEQDRKTYFNWLENIEPWCISRQLWWGHQIPVWYGFDLRRTALPTTRATARSTRWRCCAF
jgi:valyl-tRNA synthetase